MAQQTEHAQSSGPHYRAYLVRLWRDDVHEPWRASAQSVQSGELVRFATLQELFVFLEVCTSPSLPASQPPTSQLPTNLTDE